MKQSLALDSGGTKVMAILYDEDFRIRTVCRSGSLRDNTTSRELIGKNVDKLMSGLGLNREESVPLERITGTIDGVFYNRLKESCTIGSVCGCGELDLGLCAAGIFGDALLALSGTGATLFSRYNGKNDGTGGYGAAVSDAGSGYWLGRNAMNAAIAWDEERGEKTILREMITEHFGASCLRDAIFSIYSKTDISPAACVASCAPLVSRAALAGDRIALNLLCETGTVLGEQLLYLIRKNRIPAEIPVTISGSVWRGHPALFASFRRIILNHTPDRQIIIPEFEPIVGAVILHYYQQNGRFADTDLAFFRKEYADYAFSIQTFTE